ncbi:hypothetical protein QJS10_CPA10g00366 [Acorus calamus]|uniref:Uncharacterized protein n=1 Tax=Acorus calamus TaxID=4465 RepID=A0AAV9E350_ACOCL|nr:hypothetical protein QJS10_CPA10g00366 [Acorus calamus]
MTFLPLRTCVRLPPPPPPPPHHLTIIAHHHLRLHIRRLSPPTEQHRSRPYGKASIRRASLSPGGPPPPPPEQDDDSSSSTGFQAALFHGQDGVRIFFAVLFWMALFFWACTWDGRDGGRPNKGSQFRR